MNPRWRVEAVLREAGAPDPALAERLGLDPAWGRRYPHELSGGQLQRVSILRAFSPQTRFLVADEISAPLDAIAQERFGAWCWRSSPNGASACSRSARRGALLARVADRQVCWRLLTRRQSMWRTGRKVTARPA